MSIVGFQEFWTVGSRLLFKRDDVDGAQQPWIDLGVMQSVAPAVTPERITLFDPEGGVRRLVDEALTSIEEVYEFVCSNFNEDNLSLIFLGKPPQTYTQTASEKVGVTHRGFPGRLIKLTDSDTAKTPVAALAAVAGIYTGAVATKTLTTIVAATKTITLSGDQTAVAGLAPGKVMMVNRLGLTNILNSRSYTIVTRTLNGGNTDFVVDATPAANETANTGQATHENGGTVYKQDTDWELVSLDRGVVRMMAAGAFVTEADLLVTYSLAALSGKRLINPQDFKGIVRGKGLIYLARNNYADQHERYIPILSLTPAGVAPSAEEFSNWTLRATVINDLSASVPAGTLKHIKGNLPSVS
jgi:hypothetical protein